MKDTICDTGNASILIQAHHGHLAIMKSRQKQISVIGIDFYIAGTHATDPCLIDLGQIPIFIDRKGSNTLILNGIQIFAVVCNGNIGWITDRCDTALCQFSLFHVNVIHMNTNTILMRISSYICYILLLCHNP